MTGARSRSRVRLLGSLAVDARAALAHKPAIIGDFASAQLEAVDVAALPRG